MTTKKITLSEIQAELKAPKGQYNSFGKYHYRSCEDIVEAVKPILAKHGYALVISDEMSMLGDRFYVHATAKVMNGTDVIAEASAYAREPLTKKGMDESQITGAASSYARKYALNGLFAIDDTKDADTLSPDQNAPTVITEQQVADLEAMIEEVGANREQFLKWAGVDAPAKILSNNYQIAINALEAKRKAKEVA